jgi:pescadillo protein
MGNRVKGRVKKKSVKAALGSSAGSKRKLTRMGKRQKREHAGLEASFIGRSKCLKLLQISLKDFRRLCILKGIYPREPLGRTPGNKKGQSYYHIKDVRAIAHEPVLEKFRDFRAYMKKVRRAAGRNEKDEAIRKNALVPTYTIHHLVKERYPRFSDALSDLDDALTLSYLFAALPAEKNIKSKVAGKAKTLVAAWGAYCATTGSISKSFISVKGVYLEATVQGSQIRWVVPHSFTQYMPEDVDYRVMQTFFEFYETLLNFVLFKLFNVIGVRYPFPVKQLGDQVVGSTSAILGANLRALTNSLNSSNGTISTVVDATLNKNPFEPAKKSKSSKKDKVLISSVNDTLNQLPEENSEDEMRDDDDNSVDVSGPLQAALESMAQEQIKHAIPGGSVDLDDDAIMRKRMFEGLTFFLSREVPRGYLELICLAYGGKVGWEGQDSPISVKDSTITHHIIDRPKLPVSYESLPKSREYVQPQWILDSANFMFLLPIGRYAVGAELPPHLSPWVDDEEEGYKPAYAEEIERLKNGEPARPVDVETEPELAEESPDSTPEDIQASDEDEEDEGADLESKMDNEDVLKRQQKKRKKEEDEAHELAKTMMSRKASHLYNRMQHGIAQKQAKVDMLSQRRKDLGQSKERDATGKSMLKQKVERLKDERRTVETTYSETGGSMKKTKKIRKSK